MPQHRILRGATRLRRRSPCRGRLLSTRSSCLSAPERHLRKLLTLLLVLGASSAAPSRRRALPRRKRWFATIMAMMLMAISAGLAETSTTAPGPSLAMAACLRLPLPPTVFYGLTLPCSPSRWKRPDRFEAASLNRSAECTALLDERQISSAVSTASCCICCRK